MTDFSSRLVWAGCVLDFDLLAAAGRQVGAPGGGTLVEQRAAPVGVDLAVHVTLVYLAAVLSGALRTVLLGGPLGGLEIVPDAQDVRVHFPVRGP